MPKETLLFTMWFGFFEAGNPLYLLRNCVPVPDDVDADLAAIEAALERHLAAKPLASWTRLAKRLWELDVLRCREQAIQQAIRAPGRIRWQ